MPDLPSWLVFVDPDDADDTASAGAPDQPDHDRHRRTRRTALIGLAVVAAVVAVTVALVAVFVDTSAHAPTTPRAAAQVWVNTITHRSDVTRRRFECPQGSASLRTVRAAAELSTHITAQPARPTGPDSWDVPLDVDDAQGHLAATVTVQVVRRHGAYLVC